MGLFEQTVYDQRTGLPVNNSFADYIVSPNPDCSEIDVAFLNYPDKISQMTFTLLGRWAMTQLGCGSGVRWFWTPPGFQQANGELEPVVVPGFDE